MRLIQTDGQGHMLGEVKTFDPLMGIESAINIAQQQGGDGVYWVDTGRGKFYEFTLQDGQPTAPLTEEGWQAGNPAEQLDSAATADRVRRPASDFGGFFMDPDETEEAANFLIPQPPAPPTEPVAVEVPVEAPAEEAPVEEGAAVEEEAPAEEPAVEEAPAEEATADDVA